MSIKAFILFSVIFLFAFLPVFNQPFFNASNASSSSNNFTFTSHIVINSVSNTTSFSSSVPTFTLYEDAGSSYASGTAQVAGSLIRGKVNNLTFSFTPNYFDTHTGFFGTVYTVIAVGLTSATASYTEYSQGSSNGADTASQSFSASMVNIDQTTSISIPGISIKSNTDSITISFSISGNLEQEINNDPTNTRYVSASGSTNSLTLDTQSQPSSNLFEIIGFFVILAFIVIIVVVIYEYNKRNIYHSMSNYNVPPQNMNNHNSPVQNNINTNDQIFCSNCGKPNQFNASFCNFCGQKILR